MKVCIFHNQKMHVYLINCLKVSKSALSKNMSFKKCLSEMCQPEKFRCTIQLLEDRN